MTHTQPIKLEKVESCPFESCLYKDLQIKVVFDARKKRCTGKFKIFELSALRPIAQQIFYSQSNCRKEAPCFECGAFCASLNANL